MGMCQDTLSLNLVNEHHSPLVFAWTVFSFHLELADSGVGASAWKKQSRIIKAKTGDQTYYLLSFGFEAKKGYLSGVSLFDLLNIYFIFSLADTVLELSN